MVEINLGVDSKVDKLIFNLDDDSYKSTGSDTLGYNVINDFDVSDEDLFGLFYDGNGFGETTMQTLNTSATIVPMASEALIERDTSYLISTNLEAIDTVSEAKSSIATTISSLGDDIDTISTITYVRDRSTGARSAILNGANFTSMNPRGSNDLASSDSFSVASIAKVLGDNGSNINRGDISVDDNTLLSDPSPKNCRIST